MTIFTAGYEGLNIDTFIARLKQARIDKVLDVREYPVSRKPGFSKKSFAQRLEAAGIAYQHSPPLGCPKPIRARYKIDSDWANYSKDFRAYIRTQEAILTELVADAAQQRICMVCYEADASFCHRSLIAEAAQVLDASITPKHLPIRTMGSANLLEAVA
jgi:uncharacterized protein (DUF488 family)